MSFETDLASTQEQGQPPQGSFAADLLRVKNPTAQPQYLSTDPNWGAPTEPSAKSSPHDALIDKYAAQFGVPQDLVRSVIAQESGGKRKAVSGKGAQGLMQLMPGTAAEMGVTDPFDPEQNIKAGVGYLKKMLDRFGGDEDKALAAYNAGPTPVERHGGIPPYPETQAYVPAVQAGRGAFKVADPGSTPGQPAPDEFYDYAAARAAGAKPDASGHWPSQFKKPGHPNLVVGGFDTRNGQRVPGTPRMSEAELVAHGWDPETAKALAATPEVAPRQSVVDGAPRMRAATIPERIYDKVQGAVDTFRQFPPVKAGEAVYEELAAKPARGAVQLAQGAVEGATLYPRAMMGQAKPDDPAKALNNIFEGGMKLGAPLVLPTLASSPLLTAGMVSLATIASEEAIKFAAKQGWNAEYQRLAGNVAAAAVLGVGGKRLVEGIRGTEAEAAKVGQSIGQWVRKAKGPQVLEPDAPPLVPRLTGRAAPADITVNARQLPEAYETAPLIRERQMLDAPAGEAYIRPEVPLPPRAAEPLPVEPAAPPSAPAVLPQPQTLPAEIVFPRPAERAIPPTVAEGQWPPVKVEAVAPTKLDQLRAQAAQVLVDTRQFHPDDAAAYAAKLGGEKELAGFLADNTPEALAALEAEPAPVAPPPPPSSAAVPPPVAAPPVPPAVEPPTAKQPWEMTDAEWAEQSGIPAEAIGVINRIVNPTGKKPSQGELRSLRDLGLANEDQYHSFALTDAAQPTRERALRMPPKPSGAEVAKAKFEGRALTRRQKTLAASKKEAAEATADLIPMDPVQERREMSRLLTEMNTGDFTPTSYTNIGEDETFDQMQVLSTDLAKGKGQRLIGTGRATRLRVSGSAGAPIYDDILAHMPGASRPTRAGVIAAIQAWLDTGKVTNATLGALEVARIRAGLSRARPGHKMTVPMPFELAEADPMREERELQAERDAIQAEPPDEDVSFDPAEFEPDKPYPFPEKREAQPDLPGTEGVRSVENKTPELELPYALTPNKQGLGKKVETPDLLEAKPSKAEDATAQIARAAKDEEQPEWYAPGDTQQRVVWGVKRGDTLALSKPSDRGVSGDYDQLGAIHVGDPDYWRKRLAEDYDREAKKGKVINIRTEDNDVLVDDPQYAMDPEGGEKASSSVLLTTRKELRYGVDWVFKGEEFTDEPIVVRPAKAERETTYFNGDKAAYTGKVEQIHGGTFYEVEFLEGARKGEMGVVKQPPKSAAPSKAEAARDKFNEKDAPRKELSREDFEIRKDAYGGLPWHVYLKGSKEPFGLQLAADPGVVARLAADGMPPPTRPVINFRNKREAEAALFENLKRGRK